MSQYLAPDPIAPKPPLLKWLIIALALTAIVGALFLGYRTYSTLSTLKTTNTTTNVPDPTGTLMLTYTKEGKTLPELHSFNLTTKELITIPNTEGTHFYTESTEGTQAYAQESTDGTFVLKVVAAAGEPLFLYPPKQGTIGHLTFNSQGTQLLYELRPYDTDRMVTDTSLVLVDLATEAQTIIETGISPSFYSDDIVFFLKQDGVYYTTLSTKVTERAYWFEERDITGDVAMVFHTSGEDMIITTPSLGFVESYFVSLSNENTIILEQNAVTKQIVQSPVLSPDGKKLAFMHSKQSISDRSAFLQVLDMQTSTVVDGLVIDDEEDAINSVVVTFWK